MSTLVIEDFDEALMRDLRHLAAHNGLAIDVQAKQLLRTAVPHIDRMELIARLEAIAAMTPKDIVQTDSVELLREDRQR